MANKRPIKSADPQNLPDNGATRDMSFNQGAILEPKSNHVLYGVSRKRYRSDRNQLSQAPESQSDEDPEAGQGYRSLTDEWLTTEEAAKYLKVSVPSLRNMTSNGKIPFYKFDRRNRYRVDDLRKLLLRNPRGGFYGNKLR